MLTPYMEQNLAGFINHCMLYLDLIRIFIAWTASNRLIWSLRMKCQIFGRVMLRGKNENTLGWSWQNGSLYAIYHFLIFFYLQKKKAGHKLIFIEVFAFLRLANQRLVYRYTLPQDAFRVDDANILAMSQTFWHIPKRNIWGYAHHSKYGETWQNVDPCEIHFVQHDYIEDSKDHGYCTHVQISASNSAVSTHKKRNFLQCLLWFEGHEAFFGDSNKDVDPGNSVDSLYKCIFWC